MIYLDNNATTRVLPEVIEAMLPFYNDLWGNPSSLHRFGSEVAPHIDRAREAVAKLVGAQRPSEITFTSGGTESNNLALRGILQSHPTKKHLVTTAVEHPSILKLCQQLEKEGYAVTYLSINKNGALDLKELEEAIRPDTALVSIMWANNETGILFPIEKIGKICATKNVLFHVDAIQVIGKMPVDVQKAEIHLLSLSGHKFHAPKGIGALYVRRGTRVTPQIIGGPQEYQRRGGTQNVAAIVGLGKAATLAKKHLEEKRDDPMAKQRDQLEEELRQKFPWILRNGSGAPRVPNTASLSFGDLDGETICLLLSETGIAASTGSACTAGSLGPSHVLKAMGLPTKQANATLRFSLSIETIEKEIEQTVQTLEKIILRLKKSSLSQV